MEPLGRANGLAVIRSILCGTLEVNYRDNVAEDVISSRYCKTFLILTPVRGRGSLGGCRYTREAPEAKDERRG